MKIIKLFGLVVLIVASVLFFREVDQKKKQLSDEQIREYAAQMLMVGFKGDSIDKYGPAARYVRDLKVGGIVLFDVDLTGDATVGSRNITSVEKLKKLTTDLQSYADYKLLISVDQEGGRVMRLKEQYGFSPTVSAEYLGQVNNSDTTKFYAGRIAKEMQEVGLNINLAPLLDIHNPECPVIGKLQRSFSADTAVITEISRDFIKEHRDHNVLCAVKHFPGHGSATDDSHYDLADVTNTWSRSELAPYRELIEDGDLDMVMTAHIFNRQLDPEYPATLSKKMLTGVLREELGFDGVIVTDDLYMKGIIDKYDIRDAVVLAINAGADILLMGNNISTGFEESRPFRVVDMIFDAVKAGKISQDRLRESHERIEALKLKLRK